MLDGISWTITPGSRVGLVGENGAGKTTLLRAIAGEIEIDGGSISLPGRLRVGYLPQDLMEIDDMPLLNYLKRRAGLEKISADLSAAERAMASALENSPELKSLLAEHGRLQREFEAKGGFAFDIAAMQVLRGLGFHPEEDSLRSTAEFSGGWKMRITLAALLLSEPDVLLLDEPTNHLDTESMEWLENWLKDFRGTMVAVSHDRRFLDNMATSVAELSRGAMTLYSCSHARYLLEREERRIRIEAEWEQQKEKIEGMRRFIERFRYKATKAAQVQSRIKQLEKMEIVELDGPSKSVTFSFPEAPRSGREVLSCKGLTKKYGEKTVFSGLELRVQRGERVALVGANGAGKSTLLRLLNGSEEATEGIVSYGLNVKKAYFSQESSQNLDYGRTIWQEVNNTGSKMLETEKRSLLGAFLFSGDDIHKPVPVLSGGEKSRVGLLKMLLSESNLLILDEPTNHLDHATRELFQRALLEYGGTIIIVSHDRAFLDDLVGRVVEIRDGKLYDYNGNYSRFIEKRAEKAASISEPKKRGPKPVSQGDWIRDQKRAEAEERNRLYRERKMVEERLVPLEKTIEQDELRKEDISRLLCDPEILDDSDKVKSLMIELGETEKRLEESYPIWEKLVEEMESIQ